MVVPHPEIDIVFRPSKPDHPDLRRKGCNEYLDQFEDMVQPHHIKLHINGHLDSISSGCIAIMARMAGQCGHKLEIITYTTQAQEVIRILGFARVVPVRHYDGREPDTETFTRSSR